MSKHYDLDFSGKDAENHIVDPIDGPSGLSGKDGSPAENGWWSCEAEPGKGDDGIGGISAPPAPAGANGSDAYDVVITCNEYVGAPLQVAANGGKGADGSSGGRGGDGGNGGKAGSETRHCKQFAAGGRGGYSGQGGNAGQGGDGGNAGNITVIAGSGLSQIVAADAIGGDGGKNGEPGNPGTAGTGGTNSDGTEAMPGAKNGPGEYAGTPTAGKGGNIVETVDHDKPGAYLQINVSQTKL